MSVLVIAEKPSVDRAISPVVGAGKTNKGYIEGGGYIVTWCVGHLVSLKYPNDYGNGWENKEKQTRLSAILHSRHLTILSRSMRVSSLLIPEPTASISAMI